MKLSDIFKEYTGLNKLNVAYLKQGNPLKVINCEKAQINSCRYTRTLSPYGVSVGSTVYSYTDYEYKGEEDDIPWVPVADKNGQRLNEFLANDFKVEISLLLSNGMPLNSLETVNA